MIGLSFRFNGQVQRRTRRPSGFTLVEVVLAIGLAVGILVVALHFYQRSAHLRSQLIEESDRLSAMRLLMDRITSDLRTFQPQRQAYFSGDASTLHLVTTTLPAALIRRAWTVSGSPVADSDLKRIVYGTTHSLAGTNSVVTGVFRSEEPFVDFRSSRASTVLSSLSPDSGSPTNRVVEPLTDQIHFVRFSYWNGATWTSEWNGQNPPSGVAVSLGFEAMTEALDETEYEGELFRRVIPIPTHGPRVAQEVVAP
jgi:type II secretory pathway pseudopilin PulG